MHIVECCRFLEVGVTSLLFPLQISACPWSSEQPEGYRIQNPNPTGEYKTQSPETGSYKGLLEHAVYKASVNGYTDDVK